MTSLYLKAGRSLNGRKTQRADGCIGEGKNRRKNGIGGYELSTEIRNTKAEIKRNGSEENTREVHMYSRGLLYTMSADGLWGNRRENG